MGPLRKRPSRMAQEFPRLKSEGVGSGLRAAFAVGATSLVLSGCAHFDRPAASPCAGWRQINPTADDIDAISDPLAGQILSHNMHGADVCGWVPPTKKAD